MRNFSFDSDFLDLTDRSILVTGGTGSFGKAFVRRVLESFSPRRLIVFSRDEFKQYEMAQEFSIGEHPALRYFIGDVRNVDRLEMAMRDVDIVVHAAALKHVPAAEYNPFECIYTNVHGAENVVKAALRTGVSKVIALSTDKAASPINLYGASKLASDKIFVAANNLSGGRTLFSVVRYGNVIGSRGSVVPFFRKLVQEGAAELPITDPRMTRFWITIEQGVNFVLSSLATMRGGEIFVPKIPSTKIIDLAEAISPGLPLKMVGIRPGEKLHEVMITEDDARNTFELEDRYVIEAAWAPWLTDEAGETPSASGSARLVAEGFRYASDSNPEQLSTSQIVELLEATGL